MRIGIRTSNTQVMQRVNIVTETVEMNVTKGEKKAKKPPKPKPQRLTHEEILKNQYLTHLTYWYATQNLVEVDDGGNIQEDHGTGAFSAWCTGKLKVSLGQYVPGD